MKPLPQISEAEFEVMRIIWNNAPISTNEIVDKLVQTTSWSPKTIQTLIKRLVTKKAIAYEKESRMFVYTPLVEEREYIRQESNTFLKKYFNGNISAMLSAYLENDKLSDAERNDLRSLLEQKSQYDDWLYFACKKNIGKAFIWLLPVPYLVFIADYLVTALFIRSSGRTLTNHALASFHAGNAYAKKRCGSFVSRSQSALCC